MASSSPRKNNNQSESAKTEQITTEFFSKSLHIILESRSPCVSSRNFSGEQTFSSPSSSSSSSSSVRPRDKWFNLALRECPAALENLDLWRQRNLEPMVVDVVLVKRPVDLDTVGYSPRRGAVENLALQERFPSSWNSRDEDFMMETKSEKIIERWIVQYETRNKSKEVKNVSKRGGSNTSHSLYRKSVILLRSLYLTVRILPAYKLYRDLNSSAQIHTFSLAHRVSSFVEPFTQREEADMHQFAFTPVETSCGRLCLTVLYRPTLSDVNLEPLTPISPRFIPDYVGSPTTHPLKRFPSLPRTGLESPSSGPFARRHSWSYDAFRNSPPLLSPSPSPAYSDSRAISSKLNSNQPQLLCSPHHPPENPYTRKSAGFDEYWPSPMLSPSPSPPMHSTDLSKALLRSGSAPVSIPTAKLGTNPASNLRTSHVPPLSPSPRQAKAKSASQTDNAKAPMKFGDNPAGITTKKISAFGKEECGNSTGTKLSSHISPRISSTRSLGRFSFQDDFDDPEFCPFAVDDIDTTDPCVRLDSFDGKGHSIEPLDPGGILQVRKSQDAAVGSLVRMLKTAQPLCQDFSNSKVLQVSKPQVLSKNIQEPAENVNSEAGIVQNPASSFGITSSGIVLVKTASEALQELQSYMDMKENLLKQGSEYQTLANVYHAADTVENSGI
ncbi:Autophagy-related protein 13b [Thalictrum thalictroides]|uniref:Autophagy-related protein 13b n=1 Tax=Thalictrum thalictroides TaxID=46969 RepID=A0A7J6W7V7_THATH|nr:Autophagy-related protein 13b [Thalictrum thalictroides]